MKVILYSGIFLMFLLPFSLYANGLEYMKKGLACKETDYQCLINNFEKALKTNTLKKDEEKLALEHLKTNYNAIIDQNLSNWPAQKVEKYCKRGISLSSLTSTTGDMEDISFYLWIAVSYSDILEDAKAKSWISKAKKLIAKKKYRADCDSEAVCEAFEQYAYKIISAVENDDLY
jgi:hypothetical protein